MTEGYDPKRIKTFNLIGGMAPPPHPGMDNVFPTLEGSGHPLSEEGYDYASPLAPNRFPRQKGADSFGDPVDSIPK